MTSLVKWQFFSMVSRFVAMAVGIAQSIFIVRLLSTADYGLVGLVTSVGSVVGIVLHLGLVSSTTKEIAAAKSREEQFEIFITAFIVRFVVAFILALGLLVAAPSIARRVYNHPEISLALQIFSVILLIQSVQGIFDAVLSGFKKFRQVFIYQAMIAVVSFVLFIPLVYKFGFYGYFYALLLLAFVSSVVLLVLALQCFQSVSLFLPSWGVIRSNLIRLFSVGFAIYFVKILFTLWQRSGPLVLGKTVTAAELGVFNFALFYASKLMTASDAVTAVNLPVFSGKYANGLDKFRRDFISNFERIFAFITIAAVFAVYWAPDLFRLVVGSKYDAALPLVPLLMISFWCYSFVNILKSSLLIPAKMNLDMIISYLLLFLSTAFGVYFFTQSNMLYVISCSMCLGALLALLWQSYAVQRRLDLVVFSLRSLYLLIFLSPLLIVYAFNLVLPWKFLIFGLDFAFILYFLQITAIFRWRSLLPF